MTPHEAPLLIIGICLLLGAVVNVAVAWGLAIHSEVNSVNPSRSGFTVTRSHRALPADRIGSPVPVGSAPGPTHWQVRRLERTGTVLAVVAVVVFPSGAYVPFEELLPPVRGLAEDIRLIEASSPVNWDTPGFFVWDGRGWPCISLSCCWPWWEGSVWPQAPIEDGLRLGSPTAAHPWPYGVHQLRGLPLKPIWPGFAINTLFYATLLWLLIPGPFALRRFVRVQQGFCPKCAYPMGASSVCTECGRELPKRASTP